jgi:hypothetical protein
MEDFPIWLKLVIWGTIGLTVLYTIWGMLHSYLQAYFDTVREGGTSPPSSDPIPANQIRFFRCAIPFETKLRYDRDSTTIMRGHR